MGECPHRDSERPGQAEICQLQRIGAAIDEQILRFQVPVQDSVRVAVGDAAKNLIEKRLGTCDGAGKCALGGRDRQNASRA